MKPMTNEQLTTLNEQLTSINGKLAIIRPTLRIMMFAIITAGGLWILHNYGFAASAGWWISILILVFT